MTRSLKAPFSPVPVLSPGFQDFGNPARTRSSPVREAIIQSMSSAREGIDSTSCVNIRSIESTMARGVVVSRGSPGTLVLSAGSLRSSRDDLVAERAEERGERRRPANAIEQNIGGGVVALRDHGAAQLADGHRVRARGELRLDRGGIGQQILSRDGQRVIERERLAIHLPEQRGRQR